MNPPGAWTNEQRDRARLAFTDPGLVAAYVSIRAQFAAAHPDQDLVIPKEGGYRSAALQAMTHASGASGYTGTTSFSKHQFFPSRALDFLVLGADGKIVGNGRDPRYRWAAEKFENVGYKAGFRFLHPDWDHVELFGPLPNLMLVRDGYAAFEKATSGVA